MEKTTTPLGDAAEVDIPAGSEKEESGKHTLLDHVDALIMLSREISGLADILLLLDDKYRERNGDDPFTFLYWSAKRISVDVGEVGDELMDVVRGM